MAKDEVQAVRWYRLAAEQGYAGSQYWLGELYERGEGVPKDRSEAIRLYELAAKQGYAPAKKCVEPGYAECAD